MTFSISSKYYDADSGELFDELCTSACGFLEIKDGLFRIVYRESSEGQQTLTELSFQKKDEISLKKQGAAKYELSFIEGKKCEFLYYAPPLSFDAEVYTHSIKNSLCIVGGCVAVEYSMNVGGHRQRVLISINAEAKEK